MNSISPFPDKSRIKEEAGRWLACLDRGALTEAESAELREWLSRSSFHREYLAKLVQNWDCMDILAELAELFPLRGMQQVRGEPPPPGDSRKWLRAPPLPILAASALAAGFVAAFLFLATGPGQAPEPTHPMPPALTLAQSYSTAVGERADLQLPDGSTVLLNTHSHMTVNFAAGRRWVRLQQGEAGFQVARDTRRPFIVHAGAGTVRAVGTAFNVRLIGPSVDVTVTEGTVQVTVGIEEGEAGPPPQAPDAALEHKVAVLKAGNVARYHRDIDLVAPVSVEEITRKLAWRQGTLIFKGEELERALEEIGRYTNQRLVIVDPSIRGTRVGGYFKTGDIDALLATLDQGFHIKSERIAPDLIHLSAK